MTVFFLNSASDQKLSETAYKILSKKLNLRKNLNILISGGKSLKKFFSFIISKNINMSNVNFILSDERIVSEKSAYSNTANIKYDFINKFQKEKRPNFIFPSIKNINISNRKICREFRDKLNFLPTLAFIGVGEDGHLASIFNSDIKIQYSETPFLICKKKNEKFRRISIDMDYLINIPKIVLIILDKKKYKILNDILNYKTIDSKAPIFQLLTKSRKDIFILYNKNIIK